MKNSSHRYIHPASAVILILIAAVLASCSRPTTYDRETDAILAILDREMAASASASAKALATADSLADVADITVSPHAAYALHLKVADIYSDLDLLKALHHTLKAVELARTGKCGPEASRTALIRLAALYNSQGYMTKEASEILDSIDVGDASADTRLAYSLLGVQLNHTLAQRSFDRNLARQYNSRAMQWRDSVLAIDPQRIAIAANRLLESGKDSEARDLLLHARPDTLTLTPEAASIYFNLANVYTRIDTTPGSAPRREAILNFACAAAADMHNGSRNYRSLSRLASMLLDEGDIGRAHRYIHKSADDAAASHASKRQIEMPSVLAEIDSQYYTLQQRRRTLIFSSIILAVIAVAATAAFLVMMRRKNRRLKSAALRLKEANDNLRDAYRSMERLNQDINNESRIKEAYIREFMQLCLSYLKKMEHFRAGLAKIAASGNLDKLTAAINSSRYVNREIAEFYDNFDSAFLSLYPDFIESLNALLEPDFQYDKLRTSLTTELRIYALVTIGITESAEISHFLRCSESTVYNYRTRMRNHAKNRSTFEQDFLNIRPAEK